MQFVWLIDSPNLDKYRHERRRNDEVERFSSSALSWCQVNAKNVRRRRIGNGILNNLAWARDWV